MASAAHAYDKAAIFFRGWGAELNYAKSVYSHDIGACPAMRDARCRCPHSLPLVAELAQHMQNDTEEAFVSWLRQSGKSEGSAAASAPAAAPAAVAPSADAWQEDCPTPTSRAPAEAVASAGLLFVPFGSTALTGTSLPPSGSGAESELCFHSSFSAHGGPVPAAGPQDPLTDAFERVYGLGGHQTGI